MELSWIGTLILLFFVTILVTVWTRRNRQSTLPPGPTPLPLLGNILQINFKDLVHAFVQLGSRYGPVSMVHLGRKKVLVLNGYDVVREAFVDKGEAFNDRAELAMADIAFKGYGVLFSNGERWKQMRRFTLSTLRNFGMGKRSLEERVQEEAKCLAEEFQKKGGAPFDPTYLLSLAVSNIVCSIVFNERFDYEDEEFLSMLALIKETFRIVTSPWAQIFALAPRLFMYFPGTHHTVFRNFDKMTEFVMKKIRMHEATLDENCPRDYIDCFLIKMREEKDNLNTEFNFKNLIVNAINLFFAGAETSGTTLRYSLLILLKYPDVRKKIQEEIDCVIGQSRCPSVEDKINMPYTDAVIHEVQRFADIVPLGLPHATSQDTNLRGYHIPKGTTVFPMLTTVLKDKKYFRNPQMFDPQHFLDDEGKLKKIDAFIPFSVGKRICLGESLARMEIFLFLTYILQMFDLQCNMNTEEIDISPVPNSGSFIPRPYMISMSQR
ncbi:PREDICTED: cytochrome P450 2C23-like [Nanorana parkeri]|uniref:cytochrome P450 2C23-like n=1 Tax=Nanorana parkeri TaxID=125878 RepID=UPI0008541AD4|nr:PREDICTED: cytochrome P450 2C23-like [Nanorana parkeri]